MYIKEIFLGVLVCLLVYNIIGFIFSFYEGIRLRKEIKERKKRIEILEIELLEGEKRIKDTEKRIKEIEENEKRIKKSKKEVK